MVRSIEMASPAFTYTTTAQDDDFGSPATVLRVRVSQISQAYGRGIPAEATFEP